MCGLLRYSLYGTRDAAQNSEEELASTLGDLGLTRRRACPCVWRSCIKEKDIVATVHGDDITIGGQRSAVESLIRMSKKYEIKKQVFGGDPDLEKSGGILNRVIEWERDGITIEADQRPFREIVKGLGLERANHSATPCAVERREEGKGENQCGRRQSKHRRNDVNDDDNRSRPQMADDDAIDSQALTGGDITRCRALVARTSLRKIAQISSSHQCVYAARSAKCGCATWSASRELAGTPSASPDRMWVPLATAW